MLEKEDIRKIKVKDMIHLTDYQSLQDNVSGISYDVISKEHFCIAQNLDVYLFEIKDLDNVYLLFVVESDADYQVKLFFTTEDYPNGNRLDVVEGDGKWLFLPPDNSDDFYVEDLKYAPFITPPFSHDLLPQDTEFASYGFKNGMFHVINETSSIMIKEYKTTKELLNQFLLIIERFSGENAGENSQGYITVMQGADIDKTDIELFGR